uniref:Uncharacterized protein n=1 Tax=Oryza punctata TaxID=4537 RepID=A0A0E0M133_ORYPU
MTPADPTPHRSPRLLQPLPPVAKAAPAVRRPIPSRPHPVRCAPVLALPPAVPSSVRRPSPSRLAVTHGAGAEYSATGATKVPDLGANQHPLSFPRCGCPLTSTYLDILATLPPLLPSNSHRATSLVVLGFGPGSAARTILPFFLDIFVHGLEINPTMIFVSRDFFGLAELEEEHIARLFINPRKRERPSRGIRLHPVHRPPRHEPTGSANARLEASVPTASP